MPRTPQRPAIRSWVCLSLALAGAPMLADCLCADLEESAARNEVLQGRLDAVDLVAPPDRIAATARERLPAFRSSDGRLTLDGAGNSTLVARSGGEDGVSSEHVLTIRSSAGGHRIQIVSQRRQLAPRAWQVVRVEPAPDLEERLARAVAERTELLAIGAPPPAPPLPAEELRSLVADLCEGDMLDGDWPPAGGVVETAFVGETLAPERVRHRFELSPDGRGGTRVAVRRIRERPASPPEWRLTSAGRALELELDLVQALDPATGERIRTEAGEAGTRAYRSSRDRGALGCRDLLP